MCVHGWMQCVHALEHFLVLESVFGCVGVCYVCVCV